MFLRSGFLKEFSQTAKDMESENIVFISLVFQVTEEMVDILGASGHSCHLRGPIFVKGKGTITTYFVKTPFDK